MKNLTSQISFPKQISLAHPLMLQPPQISPLHAAAAMPIVDAHAGEWRQAPERLLELDPNENQRRQQPLLNPGQVHFWLPPFPDARLWSAAVDPADTCSTYTIRAFLGDLDAPLLHLRTQTKSYLQGLLRRFGFDDFSGTRAALLQRFQAGNYGIPFVEYRIDSRECLQRLLVVCPHACDGPDHQDFLATMPNRGDCPWGQALRRPPVYAKRTDSLEHHHGFFYYSRCSSRSCKKSVANCANPHQGWSF
jgi:hypothetical protein